MLKQSFQNISLQVAQWMRGTWFQTGWETLSELFKKQVQADVKQRKGDYDDIFDRLKNAVLEAALSEHRWDNKALDYLVILFGLFGNS